MLGSSRTGAEPRSTFVIDAETLAFGVRPDRLRPRTGRDRKGIDGSVLIDGIPLTGWDHQHRA